MARHSRKRFNFRSHTVAIGPGEGIGFVWPSGRGKGVPSSNDESQPAKMENINIYILIHL